MSKVCEVLNWSLSFVMGIHSVIQYYHVPYSLSLLWACKAYPIVVYFYVTARSHELEAPSGSLTIGIGWGCWIAATAVASLLTGPVSVAALLTADVSHRRRMLLLVVAAVLSPPSVAALELA